MNNGRENFVMLVVMDGWGMAPPSTGNAISQAKTVNFNRFWSSYPHTQLRASGDAVGLPRGEVGNTETGHLNLGAGRIVYQDLARINMSIADGAFYENEVLLKACDHTIKNNSSLHIMGLLGAGGVHSSIEHLFSLIHLAKMKGVSKLYIHVFTDGRDSPPNASATYVRQLQDKLNKEQVGKVASVMGRYWAMDRDQRWDRTAKAYFALSKGEANKFKTVEDAISASYEKNVSDEFIEPALITGADGKVNIIGENDAVIFFNFRIDRPRQLAHAFVAEDIKQTPNVQDFDPYAVEYEHTHAPAPKAVPSFNRGKKISNLFFVTMTEYSKPLVHEGAIVAFPPENVKMSLGRVVSLHNLRQLRAAESEKERFVTYYFNGQSERAEPGEDRLIVPSPKVATYDLKPEMSADQLTSEVYDRLVKNPVYSFALVNFANADMVGHTGNLKAAIRAVETVDGCIGRLARLVMAFGGTMLITADHGNAEQMQGANGEVNTEHSGNPVPFIAISKKFVGKAQMLPLGILGDVAPTALSLMGLPQATNMTGRNLLASIQKTRRR